MPETVPTLRRMAAVYLLKNAAEYDDASLAVMTEALMTVVPVMCGALRHPEAFAGGAALPLLMDACRTTLAERPGAARPILEDLLVRLEFHPAHPERWHEVESVADRLLTVGLFKRDIVGPTLPTALADQMRRVRKLAQHRGRAFDVSNTRRLSRAFGKRDDGFSRASPDDAELLRTQYRLRQLDAHSG